MTDLSERIPKRTRKLIPYLVGFATAAILILGIRAIRYKDPHTHYHANFAIYINGVREGLKDPSYYEEIASCSDEDKRPQHRAHLHDNVADVVHVHDKLVTWGALLANIRYGGGEEYLATPTKSYQADDTHKMHFILNGKDVSNVSNQIIGDKDRLLISYGSDDTAAVQKQFETVARTAATVDAQKDPAACSGSEPTGLRGLLNMLF